MREGDVLALAGTLATGPDATGAMQMGLGADDLVAAVPLLADIAEIRAETVSRVGSHSLTFTHIAALAVKIEALAADGAQGIVVTQGTDTLFTSYNLATRAADDTASLVCGVGGSDAQAVSSDKTD